MDTSSSGSKNASTKGLVAGDGSATADSASSRDGVHRTRGVFGVRLTHVNSAQAFASVVSNITNPSSTQNNGTPAGDTYCGAGSGSGSTGWAPTFRWHFGGPGDPNGWSPSVQPSCPSGALSIRFSGSSVTVNPGSTLLLGYDFHQANKPAFTLMAFNPSITFTYKCGSGSTQTFVPSAMNPETWTGGTYTRAGQQPRLDPDARQERSVRIPGDRSQCPPSAAPATR